MRKLARLSSTVLALTLLAVACGGGATSTSGGTPPPVSVTTAPMGRGVAVTPTPAVAAEEQAPAAEGEPVVGLYREGREREVLTVLAGVLALGGVAAFIVLRR